MSARERISEIIHGDSELRMEAVFMIPFAVTAVLFWIIVNLSGVHSSVIEGYFPYADAMFNGTAPYSQQVFVYGYWNVWEYPPLAYVYLFIPRLLGSTPAAYEAVYIVMAFLTVWLGLHAVIRIADHMSFDRVKAALLYTVFMLLMIEFVYDRYDILPAVLCLVAVWMFLEKRYCTASAVVMIGTLVKLYPVLLLPVFAVWLIRKKEYSGLGRGVVAALCTMVAVVPFMLCGDITQMFAYHSERPLEIESLAASLLEPFYLFMPDSGMSIIYSFGSDNLVGGAADTVSKYITPFMVVMVLASLALYVVSVRMSGSALTPRSFSAMFLLVAAFILFGSVFSGQYIVWLVPLILLVVMAAEHEMSGRLVKMFVIVEVLTQLDFLVNYGFRSEAGDMNIIGVAVLLARNILLLVMMWYVARAMYRGGHVLPENE